MRRDAKKGTTVMRRSDGDRKRKRVRGFAVAIVLSTFSLLGACDGESELDNLDPGTDHLPGVKESPLEEGN